jgi:hypothetical protein
MNAMRITAFAIVAIMIAVGFVLGGNALIRTALAESAAADHVSPQGESHMSPQGHTHANVPTCICPPLPRHCDTC